MVWVTPCDQPHSRDQKKTLLVERQGVGEYFWLRERTHGGCGGFNGATSSHDNAHATDIGTNGMESQDPKPERDAGNGMSTGVAAG